MSKFSAKNFSPNNNSMQRFVRRRRTFRRFTRRSRFARRPAPSYRPTIRSNGNKTSMYIDAYTPRNSFPLFKSGPFKLATYVTLPWSDIPRAVATGVAGVPAGVAAYRLNSLFDPYFSLAAVHNPEYFAEYSGRYGNYIVYKVDVRISWKFNDISSNLRTCVGLYRLLPSSVGPAGGPAMTAYGQDQLNRNREIQKVNFSETTLSVRDTCFSVNMSDIEGLTRTQYMANIGTYGAPFNANPSLPVGLQIAIMDISGASASQVYTQVHFTFHAKLWNRIPESSSL